MLQLGLQLYLPFNLLTVTFGRQLAYVLAGTSTHLSTDPTTYVPSTLLTQLYLLTTSTYYYKCIQ
jgi:hypothetical protein